MAAGGGDGDGGGDAGDGGEGADGGSGTPKRRRKRRISLSLNTRAALPYLAHAPNI